MSVIRAIGLTKRYGKRRGVDAVDLDVGEGALFGFLGPNGAGKTTTIRLLLGFLQPTAGRAEVLGHDCWRSSRDVKRDVGYVPGDLRLYPWLTGRIALSMVGRIRGTDISRRGGDLADRFRLDLNVKVHQMSRGTRQKLGLVLALAHDPRLAILDEPTSGLDPLIQDELANELRDLAARGHTVFFSSHTLSEVEQLCDRIAIVREGCIVADESLAALRARARRTVTLRFVDAARAKQTEAPAFLQVIDRGGNQWRCDLEGDDIRGLASWIGEQPIEDFTVSAPNLEGLFRQFYRAAQ